MAEWLRGRLAEAERAFASSIAGWQAAGQPTLTVWHRYQLGQVQRALGRLDAAIQTYEQALRADCSARPAATADRGLAYVGLAEVAYQRNELDTRAPVCHRGHRAEHASSPHPGHRRPTGLVTLAWIRQATGDPAGALEAIGEAGQARRPRLGCSTRSRRSGRGCCWPRATWPRPPGGRMRPACRRR